ncbi:MAG: HEAT repeat domain-containing protein [candidate division Zixibacteria bacterium]|nr:HEAT repeat domain-containing protein [candidate division Zixibacteria bacterium]
MKTMTWLLVIATLGLSALCLPGSICAQSSLQHKVDSLFMIASSGDIKYRDLTGPAIDSIAALGAPAVPLLVDKFTTKSARERWTVIWVLQKIGSDAVPYLITSLQRSNGLVVQRVCWALGDIKDTTAVSPLMEISQHNRWQVREQAIGALGKITDARAADVVLRALYDSIGQVRKAAVVACGALVVQEAIGGLTHALGDQFYGARLEATNALMKLDTALVMEGLTDSVKSEDPMIGNLVCQMLGEYGTDEAIEILLEQVLNSTSATRRAHAAVALVKADPEDNCGYRATILQRETNLLTRLKIESAITSLRNDLE